MLKTFAQAVRPTTGLALCCVLLLASCGGGSGGTVVAAGTGTPPPATTPAQPDTPAEPLAPPVAEPAPAERVGLPTAAAPGSIAAGTLRFGLDTPSTTGVRVSVVNPLDGSLRTLHDHSAADLGFFDVIGARIDPLHRFAYLQASLPPPRFDVHPETGWFVAPFDSSTGSLGARTRMAVNVLPQVFTPDGAFAYMADGNGGIHGYRLGADGQLTELPGSPFASHLRTSDLKMHPSGRWILAISIGTVTQDAAVVYRLDPQTGALAVQPTDIPRSVIGFTFIALAGSDRVWWQTRDQPLTLYSFDAASGALAPVAPAVTIPSDGGAALDMPFVPDASGDFLVTGRTQADDPYVGDWQAWRLGPERNSVSAIGAPLRLRRNVTADPVAGQYRADDLVLRVDPAAGLEFTAASPVALPRDLMTVDTPARITDVTFAIDAGAQRLRALAVDPGSGSLAQLGEAVLLAGRPAAVAVSPRLDFVAVAGSGSTGSGTLALFRIDRTTAALTPLASAGTGPAPKAIAVPPGNSGHILVAHGDGIDSFELVRSDGSLRRVDGSPFPAAWSAIAAGSTQGQPLHDLPAADLLATHAFDVFVAIDQADPGGVSTLSTQSGGGPLRPQHTGNFDCAGTRRTGSTLTPTGSGTVALGAAGTSHWIYAVNRDAGTISGFLGDEQSRWFCGLPNPWVPAIPGSPFATPAQPVAIAVGQAGRFAYVAHAGGGGSVSAWAIDGSTGALWPVAGSPVALGMVPARVWTDTFGRFVYTAAADGRVMVQTIDRATGLPGAPRAASPVPLANMGVGVVLSVR